MRKNFERVFEQRKTEGETEGRLQGNVCQNDTRTIKHELRAVRKNLERKELLNKEKQTQSQKQKCLAMKEKENFQRKNF